MARGGLPLSTRAGKPNSYHQRVQLRIDSTKVVNRLVRCATGEEEMTANEIAAARILLNKTVPDLKPQEQDNLNEINDVTAIPTSRLLDVIEGKAERK